MREPGGWADKRMGGSLLAFSITLALLIVVVTSFWSGWSNREALRRIKAEAQQLEHQRDSLLTAVQGHDSAAAVLVLERGRLDSLATRLRGSVDTLEARRAAARLTVREIRTVGKLQARLRQAFPQLGKAGWGLTSIPVDQRDTIGIQYLLVPAWFAETFIIDRANAQSWRAQKDKLLAVDSLRLAVSALQDSITRLEAANADAYQAGYEVSHAAYQDLSKRHIAELRKARISLGSTLGLIGVAAVGLAAGRAIP